ncbi:Os03g0434800 [Oryza sativa Japonica Group]|uniref:Os03g0434800 protein n=2 Tax=Oryza sativa subsp. japonica TaxID=39947 RepID=A0A5S6R794_ORYSJ|nr:peroxidase, putative [Oryza sativa Japonica Group]ABF96799.1 Cationic peroxidase 1 precursor, putative [Oryza sativa Japonica Group]BAF12349.2 Os03g0434800 [Oryza sativa Japonica Group]|eukprot:NP_001050435.2 Os03g0434800 [Oryza sativa Japonica Group]
MAPPRPASRSRTQRHRLSAPFMVLLFLALATSSTVANAQLSDSYYDASCPAALLTIRTVVSAAGCDASVLLDDTGSFTGEKGAGPNAGSLRGFEVVDNAKTLLETVCPQTVSCADILAVAARDAVVQLGGPSWTVLLGRRDSTTASASLANSDLPAPSSTLATLLAAFSNKGLTTTDMVVLSGTVHVRLIIC